MVVKENIVVQMGLTILTVRASAIKIKAQFIYVFFSI
jgi:hypothetical protein